MNKRKYFIGDSCLCWSLGDVISDELSGLVLRIYSKIRDQHLQGQLIFRDVVPSYNALAVHYEPTGQSLSELESKIDAIVDQVIEQKSSGEINSKDMVVHRLPTIYKGEDLPLVAKKNNLSIEQVIELHQKPQYKVAMVGFLPHFPYLIGLDPKLETPRLDSPRTKIPAGAVAIGGAQTGIYPRESPGGWNIIGSTDPSLLEPVNPGDFIIFNKVDER